MIHPAARRAVGWIERGGELAGDAVLISPSAAITCAHVLSNQADRPDGTFELHFPILKLDVTARVVVWRPYREDLAKGSDLALLAFAGEARAQGDAHARLGEPAKLRSGDPVVTLDYLRDLPEGEARRGEVHDPADSLISLTGEHFVEKGMSGSGLFLLDSGEGLLGLVSGLPKEPARQANAYAIPADAIADVAAEWDTSATGERTLDAETRAAIETLVTLLLDQVSGNMRPFLQPICERALRSLESRDDWREEDLAALHDLQIEMGDAFVPIDGSPIGTVLPAGFTKVLKRLRDLLACLEAAADSGGLVDLTEEMSRLLAEAVREIESLLGSEGCPEVARDSLQQLHDLIRMAECKGRVRFGQLNRRCALVRKRAGEPFERGARALMACIGQRPDLAPPESIFTDGVEPCLPEMVVIPAGRFMMGSPKEEAGRYEDEGHRHEVTIAAAFALARFPVTFEQYDAFCRDTRRSLPEDEGWGRGRRPAINVFWKDAAGYCAWLGEKTGVHYHLPPEQEWEYACRAGTETAYYWGEAWDPKQANGRDSGPGKTTEVGSYPPNPWGLYDMSGNVLEWCRDVWREDYRGTHTDGPPVVAEQSGSAGRVLRGGSWDDTPRVLRSAVRNRGWPDNRLNYLGFRPARMLLTP